MSDPDTILRDLAERSAEAAEKWMRHRRTMREDPYWTEPRYWAARERGEVRALGDAIARVQDVDELDAVSVAEYLHDEHIATNEWRGNATGATERAAKGYHHGYYVALQVLKEHTDIEYEDYAEPEVVA